MSVSRRGRDHARDVLERAAAADDELRLELARPHRQLGRARRSMCSRMRRRSPFDERIAVDELCGERADAQVLARCVLQPAGVADHDLDAPAAEVEAQGRRRLEQDTRPDRAEDELGLPGAADHLDANAGLGLDPVDDLATVRGPPQRAGAACRRSLRRLRRRRADGTGARRPPRRRRLRRGCGRGGRRGRRGGASPSR